MIIRGFLPAFFLLAFSITFRVSATEIVVINSDGANEGLNDLTTVSPIGGNNGSTIGEQRLIVYEYAAAIWSSAINSNVQISIDVSFNPLPCDEQSAVLGAAGTNTIHANFTRPWTDIWHPQPLANAIAGEDLSVEYDMSAQHNSEFGTPGCLSGGGWYYGLDANAPSNRIDFLNHVLHEMAHGLGFTVFLNRETGVKFNGRDEVFILSLEDHNLNLTWDAMSDVQRVASAKSESNLHWIGSNVTAIKDNYNSEAQDNNHIKMYAPPELELGSSVAHFTRSFDPDQLLEPINVSGPQAAKRNTTLTKALLNDIGWPVFSNFKPVIGKISNATMTGGSGGSDVVIQFAVDDHDDGELNSLTFGGSSSNPSVIPATNFSITGSGLLRTLTISKDNVQVGSTTIQITVSDGSQSSSTSFVLTVDELVSSNTPPTVSISSPVNGGSFEDTDSISFVGVASDVEDGVISGDIDWTSSIDGGLGQGASINSVLSEGSHVISATVEDSDGLSALTPATINLTITLNPDKDGDNIPDAWESLYGVNDPQGDPDGDGIVTIDEYNNGTNPIDAAPVLVITAPADNTLVMQSRSVTVTGLATDNEDGDISSSIIWSSLTNNNLGIGDSVVVTVNEAMTVTATVTDSQGASEQSTPSINLQTGLAGDVNLDGVIDISDVLLLGKAINSQLTLTPNQSILADLYPVETGDDVVNTQDMLLLQKAILSP